MKKSDFYASMHTLIPGCTLEITRKWIDFAEENVDHGHFVDFKLSEDKTSGMERWLDTIYAGLCGIREQYGPKIAGKMAGLDSDGFPCFYPGEMKLAAESLLHGDTPDIIAEKMESGIIESQPPFFPMPDHQLTERDCGPEIDIIHKSVCLGLHDERIIPGFVLQDGILLLESDRDMSGCYRGGVKIGGECVHTSFIGLFTLRTGICGLSGRCAPWRNSTETWNTLN